MARSTVSSDSRERDFAAGHAIAQLELIIGGGFETAIDAGRKVLSEELAALDAAFDSLTSIEVRELLEVGCGLGTLLVPLLRRGYWVTGLDAQTQAVTSCRERLASAGLSTRVNHGDVRTIRSEADYDAVLLMRGLLSLIPSEEGQLDALRRVRKAVRPGGLVIVEHRNLLSMWPVFGRRLLRRETLSDGRVVELGRQATIISLESRVHERRWARVWTADQDADAEIEADSMYEQHDHLRIATVDGVTALLGRAGLELIHVEPHPVVEGPWHVLGPLYGTSHDDPSHVWIVARRPV